MHVCLLLVTATALTCSSTLVAVRAPWASLFSSDPQVGNLCGYGHMCVPAIALLAV